MGQLEGVAKRKGRRKEKAKKRRERIGTLLLASSSNVRLRVEHFTDKALTSAASTGERV